MLLFRNEMPDCSPAGTSSDPADLLIGHPAQQIAAVREELKVQLGVGHKLREGCITCHQPRYDPGPGVLDPDQGLGRGPEMPKTGDHADSVRCRLVWTCRSEADGGQLNSDARCCPTGFRGRPTGPGWQTQRPLGHAGCRRCKPGRMAALRSPVADCMISTADDGQSSQSRDQPEWNNRHHAGRPCADETCCPSGFRFEFKRIM